MVTANHTPSTTTTTPIANLRRLWQCGIWAIRLTWQTNRLLTASMISLTLLQSLMPALQALVARELVNAVVAALSSGSDTLDTSIWLWLGAGLVVALAMALFAAAQTYVNRRLSDELNLRLMHDILEHAAELDLAYFESTEFYDMMERARQNPAVNFNGFINQLMGSASNLVQIVSLTLILMAIEPLVVVIMVPLTLPYLLFQWGLTRTHFYKEYVRVTRLRWMRYFMSKLTTRHSVAEIKLLDLAPLLIQKYRTLLEGFRDEDRAIYRRQWVGNSVFLLVSISVFYGLMIRIVARVVAGALTVGDVTIYAALALRLRGTLESTVGSLSHTLEKMLYINNLMEYFDTRPRPRPYADPHLTLPGKGAITIENLCFTYPGTDRLILDSLSLQIQAGETVALVGENGAGKTTLVKLIAGLYGADSGRICLDGVDIEQVPLQELHRHLSFVFQGFNQYEATAAENIAYGDWRRLLDNREEVERIAQQAKVDRLITAMPQQYDTLLGRLFGEYDLSGGQWQKIAIARAFAREAALLVLDEPTSNLDARAEYEIFASFRELARGRTTILISHRFSTVSMADRIIVLDSGRIVESGTHQELLAQQGTYANLYNFHRYQMEHEEKL